MSFFEGLRDNTAAPLIAQFGLSASYRIYGAAVYDNATATTTKGTPTTVDVKLLDLPLNDREFEDDVMARAKGKFVVSAKEFADAGEVPAVGAIIEWSGDEYRILAINTVGPSGVAVIYKMAVQHV